MKQSIPIAGATLAVAAGLIGAVAPASAQPPGAVYGRDCVSTGNVSPAESGAGGPFNSTASDRSGGTGGSAANAYQRSGGKSRFQLNVACLD